MPDTYYPAPSYAATIWAAGSEIWLALPPSNGHTHGHAIHAPSTEQGLSFILSVLSARETASSPLPIDSPSDNGASCPSTALARHTLKHKPPWSDRRCPFCISEGRFSKEGTKSHQRSTLIRQSGSVQIRRVHTKKQPPSEPLSAFDLGL